MATKPGALALWQGLLAETPANSPLHQTLVDRMAHVTAQTGGGAGGAPDPRAMVAELAAQLKADPNNEAGWRRLMRAYTVLGQPDEAKTALATARKTFCRRQGCAGSAGRRRQGSEAELSSKGRQVFLPFFVLARAGIFFCNLI